LNRKAFTLVEILLAVAISSLVMLIAYQALLSGKSLADRMGGPDVLRREEVSAILKLMRWELVAAYVIEGEEREPAFKGISDSRHGAVLQFFTTYSQRHPLGTWGGCSLVRYQAVVEPLDSGWVLKRSEKVVAGEKAVIPVTSEEGEVILENFSGVTIQYLNQESVPLLGISCFGNRQVLS